MMNSGDKFFILPYRNLVTEKEALEATMFDVNVH